jgi:hypothetical protein
MPCKLAWLTAEASSEIPPPEAKLSAGFTVSLPSPFRYYADHSVALLRG